MQKEMERLIMWKPEGESPLWRHRIRWKNHRVEFEILTSVTKNALIWDVIP
jgi:hypothetical protein